MSALKGDGHWELLAANARELANQVTDPDARRELLAIAAAYARLAERAKMRMTSRSKQGNS